jgi:hypothetical protein
MFCCTIEAFKNCPSTSQDNWSSMTSNPSSSDNLHISACCYVFSINLSMYLVSEEYPTRKAIFSWACHYLCVDFTVSISIPFLESSVNLILCDLHYHAIWVEVLFSYQGRSRTSAFVWTPHFLTYLKHIVYYKSSPLEKNVNRTEGFL